MLVAMVTRIVSIFRQQVNFGHFSCQADKFGRLLRPSLGDFHQNSFLVPLVLQLSRTPYQGGEGGVGPWTVLMEHYLLVLYYILYIHVHIYVYENKCVHVFSYKWLMGKCE